jgi:hypothetical protein
MQFPLIAAVPPAAAPEHIGMLYVDTVTRLLYFSTGTSSVADWMLLCTAATVNIINTTTGKYVPVTVEGDEGPPDTRQIVLGAEP